MPHRKPSRTRLRSLCAEVHPDDGSDPRVFFAKIGSRTSPRHGAHRLCRQVLEELDASLAGWPGDDVLQGLTVVAVDPAPDSTCLLVTVGRRSASLPVEGRDVLDRLAGASRRLRSGVASAITRRKAPMLVFRLIEVGRT